MQARLAAEAPLTEIVLAIWTAMRVVKRPVGRPRYDETMFAEAVALVRAGVALGQVRRRLGFGSSVAQRIKREVEGDG